MININESVKKQSVHDSAYVARVSGKSCMQHDGVYELWSVSRGIGNYNLPLYRAPCISVK